MMRGCGTALRLTGVGTWLALASAASQAPPPARLAVFRTTSAEKARAAADRGTIVVPGEQGWLFFGPELRHVSFPKFWGPEAIGVSRATNPEYADPLPAILDLKAQLDKLGVELLLAPVPPKSLIYPDKLTPKIGVGADGLPPRLDEAHQTFYHILRARGVQVLDLTPLLLANRLHAEGAAYCQQDTHWSGRACVLAARELAKHLRARPWISGRSKTSWQHEWRTVEVTGDLWQALGDPARAKEKMRLRMVGRRTDAGLEPVVPDPTSPIVLMGDSHTLVFHGGDDMHARGAGLPDQLALELGFTVDLVAVRGSGATAARFNLLRRAQATPGYWKGKKILAWVFGAREFTESPDGWRKLPVVPREPAGLR